MEMMIDQRQKLQQTIHDEKGLHQDQGLYSLNDRVQVCGGSILVGENEIRK